MKTIDRFFKSTQKRIEDEKVMSRKRLEAMEREEIRLKKRLTDALKSLEAIAREALRNESLFSAFMFEKKIQDHYNSEKFRIIIANFKPLNIKGDSMGDEKVFRIHIIIESAKKYSEPKVFADIQNLEVSCGSWWWCSGKQHVEKETPPNTDLLHFIESIDSLNTFVETCTRSNTH